MADIMNVPNCGGTTSTFNSGVPLCDVIRKKPYALFLVDAGFVLNTAARATITAAVTALRTGTRAARGARVYPIKDLTNYEDKTTEPTKAAVGNLSTQQITMVDGIPAFDFQHRKGDLYHQQLAAAENANLKVMILDSAYVLYGTKTAGGDFTGYTMAEFYAQIAKFATATEPSKYPFSIVLDSMAEYKENFAIIQLDATVLNLSGNVDVTLSVVQASNVAKITPMGRGGKNIGSLYPTELAVVGAWVATNDQTAASVTITGVTWDSANARFNVTLDSTAWGLLTTGDKVSVNLASAAALSALSVDGFESTGSITVTK